MPITYKYDSKIILVEMSGAYSLDDIRQSIRNLFADQEYPANASHMINLTESQNINFKSPEDVKIRANVIASLGERFSHRIALIAPKDLPNGLMRLTSVRSAEKGIESEVFRAVAEARKWSLS